jgi:hypothetical protein
VGVEPGALTSGFGARGSRFGLPVWPALSDSARRGVAVGRLARMAPCGMFQWLRFKTDPPAGTLRMFLCSNRARRTGARLKKLLHIGLSRAVWRFQK